MEKQLQGLGFSDNDLAKIKNRCGVDKLVARLHTRFLQLVKTEWKTNTRASLQQKQQETQTQLQSLGRKPEDLSLGQVLAHAAGQVRCQSIVETRSQSVLLPRKSCTRELTSLDALQCVACV